MTPRSGGIKKKEFKKMDPLSILMAVLPGLVQGGVNWLSGNQIQSGNENLTREMFERQKEENERIRLSSLADRDEQLARAKEFSVAMWDKQNDYNSPQAQMERLEKAGLNKNLMYGQGTTGLATTISQPAPKPVEGESAKIGVPLRSQDKPFGDLLNSYTALRNADLQRENMSAQNSLLETKIKQEEEITRGIKRENDLLGDSFFSRTDPWYIRKLAKTIDPIKAHGNTIISAGKLALNDLKDQLKMSVMDSLGRAIPAGQFLMKRR